MTCEECGNEDAAEGFTLCPSCLEELITCPCWRAGDGAQCSTCGEVQ